jgi:hypothetical protein
MGGRGMLEQELTKMFMLYEYGRQTPFCTLEDYINTEKKALEFYRNDSFFNHRVKMLVAHTLQIVKEAK